MNIDIKEMLPKDWKTVAAIYQMGIETGIATFETEIPTWNKWDANHIESCRLAAWFKNNLVGWAALSPVSSRCVYGGVAEVSVYIDVAFNGNGIGTQLLQQLVDESESEGFWTLQSGIFPENKASIQIHKKLGFREIGYREKVGRKDGIWHDNILLERRSNKVGIN